MGQGDPGSQHQAGVRAVAHSAIFHSARYATLARPMSALGQKRTLRTILDASETIIVFNSTGAAGDAEILLVSSKDAIGRHVKTGGRERNNPRLSASVQCLSARLEMLFP